MLVPYGIDTGYRRHPIPLTIGIHGSQMSTHLVCEARFACDGAEATSQHLHAVTPLGSLPVSSPATAGAGRQTLLTHTDSLSSGSFSARDVQNSLNTKTSGSMRENQTDLNALQGSSRFYGWDIESLPRVCA